MKSENGQVHALFNMRLKSLATTLAAAALASALFATAATAGAGETVRTAGNVTYVSGGVGEESIEQLRSIAGDFNLKLVFALKSGEFLAGVEVAIADAAGKPLLQVSSDGPWLLVKLPAGRYKISATYTGNALTRNVAVGATKLSTVDFRWAAE